MNRYQTVSNVEEQYKVRDLDEAIRTIRRSTQLPWTLQKSTLKVFSDVLIYPVASDHDELAYIDTPQDRNSINYSVRKARFVFTSLQQFFENFTVRNTLVEIWQAGTKYLGLRYDDFDSGSVVVDPAADVSRYTPSGDAISVVLDTVNFKDGNSSIKTNIVNSSGSAIVEVAPDSLSLSNYKQQYYFKWIYLNSAPTSITLRYGNDSSNYLYGTVTTQFSGQAFVANDWNLVAFDLNNPTGTVGTIDSSKFDYEAIVFTGAATGTYYINYSYVRQWKLFDYWYYSFNSVKTNSSSIADQKFFYNSSEVYALDSALVGDDEWVDVIAFDAIMTSLSDDKDESVKKDIAEKRKNAWDELTKKYPSMAPIIITQKYNFNNEYNVIDYGYPR